MKELTDQELTNRIRQVFDEFEDPESAQGWEELRKKYPEEKKRPLFIWWYSAAAVFLISFALWFATQEKTVGNQNLTQKTNPGPVDNPVKKINPAKIKSEPYPAEQKISRSINKTLRPSALITKSILADETDPVAVTNDAIPKSALTFTSASNQTSEPAGASMKAADSIIIASIPRKTEAPALKMDSVVSSVVVIVPPVNYQAGKEEIKHSKKENTGKDTKKKNTKESAVFSVFAGSYFNYAEGSQSKLNFGAGFSSDIKLGNSLRLSTGIALAKNSLSYGSGVPANSDKSFSAPNSSGSPNGLTNQTLTTIMGYDADLLSLDIPVNVKYLIIPEENKLYISAGLSSGTQVNETYSYYYSNYSTQTGFYVSQGQGQQSKKQFKDFDLARTFNLSLGFSTNLSKTQNITIEPFLKYPLGGLGSENLKFGSSGINLKLNFKQSKHEKK
jgi:hypothetical protein